jgi:hypothetical protein
LIDRLNLPSTFPPLHSSADIFFRRYFRWPAQIPMSTTSSSLEKVHPQWLKQIRIIFRKGKSKQSKWKWKQLIKSQNAEENAIGVFKKVKVKTLQEKLIAFEICKKNWFSLGSLTMMKVKTLQETKNMKECDCPSKFGKNWIADVQAKKKENISGFCWWKGMKTFQKRSSKLKKLSKLPFHWKILWR